jgi:glycogen operon protein
VFNHTDEGNHLGPVFSFKGIDNRVYYYLVPEDKRYYRDYTGCGNTFNCNHPIAQKLIVESLRYWVRHGHVDGFRFDEGSVMARDENGAPIEHPPVVWQIELDEELADTKVIAEAWDAAGLYQIGRFPGDRWAEWNGRYRDDVRRFVRGEPGIVGAVATRIAGSSDLYQSHGEMPVNSINFVTCHDGFTLSDLVSYNAKHNDANGEGNRDGINDNLSWNYGAEGATDDPEIDAVRLRQIKNFATLLMLSRGVPMMLSGDEVRRTQRGNNNCYCQDNELSWFDWNLVETSSGLLRYWKRIIEFRKRNAAVRKNAFFTGKVNDRGMPEVAWHGCRLNSPGWNDPGARVLAFTLAGFNGDADIHVMMNMYWETLDFDIPPAAGRTWFVAADTSQDCPNDIADPGDEFQYFGETFAVKGRSIVVLVSK